MLSLLITTQARASTYTTTIRYCIKTIFLLFQDLCSHPLPINLDLTNPALPAQLHTSFTCVLINHSPDLMNCRFRPYLTTPGISRHFRHKMGMCFSSEPMDIPQIGVNTRVYPRDGPSFQKPIAVAHHLHRDLLKMLACNGKLCDTVSGQCTLLGECRDVDWTLQMSDPFALIINFIHNKGLHPEIIIGPYAKSPSDIRILSVSAKDSTLDWITEFLHDEDSFDALSSCCDFSVQNDGKMLVIEPKHFDLLPDGSLSSLTTQFGSLMSLAHDCNWDTTHCHPPCCYPTQSPCPSPPSPPQ